MQKNIYMAVSRATKGPLFIVQQLKPEAERPIVQPQLGTRVEERKYFGSCHMFMNDFRPYIRITANFSM
jgi:hypothetical protein